MRSCAKTTILAAAVVLAAVGCTGTRRPASRISESVWQRYFEAVADARVRERSEIVTNLVPILEGGGELAWKDGRVLMVTWTRARHYSDPVYKKGYVFPLYGPTWFTAVPEVRDSCTSYSGPDLAMRLSQLIGLPPDNEHDAFLEVWVRPRDLFRPCPDPEITDSQCQIEIPLLEAPPREPGHDEPPWYCPPAGVVAEQQQGRFVVVDQSHLDWMCENWRSSFTHEDAKDDYPWTALGYTYDWGRPDDPVGASEFVGVEGAPVVFERLVPTAAYCGRSQIRPALRPRGPRP